MSMISRTVLAALVATLLTACAQQPQGIDLTAPQPRRADAKTSLENPGKYR